MRSPYLHLRDAIGDRIETRTGYQVFDAFPSDGDPLPRVVLGSMNSRAWGDKFVPGQDVIATIDVWTDYDGSAQAAEIMDKVLDALTSGVLQLTGGFRAAFSRLDYQDLIIDIDGRTRHGILRFRFLIDENGS